MITQIGMVEGKPVFEDDILYLKSNGLKVVAQRGLAWTIWSGRSYEFSECSWNPQKPKTVLVELCIEDAKTMAAWRPNSFGALWNTTEACRNAMKEVQ